MNWLIAILQNHAICHTRAVIGGLAQMVQMLFTKPKAPSLFQPYRDLIKLTHKQPVVSKQASWLFVTAPYIIFSPPFWRQALYR